MPSNNKKLVEKAAKKIALYTELLKLGQSKKQALAEVRKQFKGGMDSKTCSKVARDLGLTNSQMKSRAAQYNSAVKAEKKKAKSTTRQAARLVRAPKEQPPQVALALPEELAGYIRRRMEMAKKNKAVFILDVNMEFDVEERQKMVELMKSMGLDKLSVFEDGFEARRVAGVFSGKL